jgi:pimeloyl-ACP methyl ester carboxylesterase
MAPPFRQGRFEELPELPRRPHGYFDVPARDVVVRSAHFGEVSTHVRERGEGEPLLLVHGLMTTSYSWRYVIDDLAEHYRVIAFDLVGAGRSDKPDTTYEPEAVADFVGELIDALDVRGARVVGNSMGGYLAMWLAIRHPTSMRALVNVHSPGVPMARLHALRLALSLPGTHRVLDRMIASDPMRWAHRNVHYRDESLKSLEEAREYGAPLGTTEGRRAFARYLHETLDPRAMQRFAEALARARFPVPLSLLYAREDPMVPPSVGPRLHALVPDAHFEWLEDASHFAHVDAPEVTVSRILDLLGREP